MSRRIQVLPDVVANQIAAGEVVERPASVVKELVENALDAGAGSIQVEISRGGRRTIRVTDDGSGMSREDALLCLDRHATSKIRSADDLRDIRSLGFRGEALPSIAAVSRMSINTREAESEVGTQVKVTGGTILTVEDSARRPGTTVEVTDLFHNAPARRKFLKGAAAETRAINEALIAVALAGPSVAFRLQSDDRILLDLPATEDLAERIRGIWGTELARDLISVELDGRGMGVRGLVQRPDAVKPGHRKTFLFVGERPFREPALLRAVDRGYRTTVPPGHRPWVFLYLGVPGDSVDVNVHPAKAEVRFRDRAVVEDLVEAAVREALVGSESSATLDRAPQGAPLTVREGRPSPRSEPDAARTGGDRDPDRRPVDQMALFARAPATGDETDGSPAGEGSGDPAEDAPRADGVSRDSAPSGTADAATHDLGMPPLSGAMRPNLWQVLDTYILAETRDGLLIIDQHSAHERILFEELMDGFDAGGQEGQHLLFPLTIRLTPAEYLQVESLQGLLSSSGFQVEGFGGDTIIVHSVPNPHPYFNPERCLREMIAELTEGSELVRSARNQHERIAMTFACKGAIKAGQRLSPAEMSELFDRLFATELPYHDVHGRPTIVRLPAAELERKFGR
jgi:DNA mismatch repair protein MutL